ALFIRLVKGTGFGGTGTLACAVFAMVTAATNCLLEVARDFKGAQSRVLLKRARIKGRSESIRRKGRIEDQKTRILEHHKNAPPKVQVRSKVGAHAKCH